MFFFPPPSRAGSQERHSLSISLGGINMFPGWAPLGKMGGSLKKPFNTLPAAASLGRNELS